MPEHPDFTPFDGEPTQLPEDAAPELVKTIALFDDAHETFLDNCAEYACGPSDASFANMLTSATLVAKTFRDSLGAINEGDLPSDEQVNGIGQLMLAKDMELNGVMHELTGCEGFIFINTDNKARIKFLKFLKKSAKKTDSMETFSNNMLNAYMSTIQNDLNHFVDDVQSKAAGREPHTPVDKDAEHYEEREPLDSISRRQLVAREVGKRALDVATIGTGVALGIWAMRKQSRNN